MSGLEIERKFLVKKGDAYKRVASSSALIRQGYIAAKGATVRVRQYGDKAYLTIKGPSTDGGLTRYEFEKEIAADEATKLLQLCSGGVVEKRRWIVMHDGKKWEVDEFSADNEGLVVAEIELEGAGEAFTKPDFIGEEVTSDYRYRNSQLLVNPYKNWK